MDFEHEPSAVGTRGLEFTVTNGQVTAIQAVEGSRTFPLRLPSDATFAVSAQTITETIAGAHAITVLTYAPETANPSLYMLSGETETILTPTTTPSTGVTAGYSFTLANGAVTAEQYTVTGPHGTYTSPASLPADAVFTSDASGVTETRVDGNTVETVHFVQPSGSSLYAVASVSTAFVSAGSATTLLSVEPHDRLEFTFGAAGAVTTVQSLGATGTATTLTPDANTTFTELAPGYVEELHTHGGHTSYEVFYAGANSGGIYTEVAHGGGSTIDLVGLQAQLAQLPQAVEGII